MVTWPSGEAPWLFIKVSVRAWGCHSQISQQTPRV